MYNCCYFLAPQIVFARENPNLMCTKNKDNPSLGYILLSRNFVNLYLFEK